MTRTAPAPAPARLTAPAHRYLHYHTLRSCNATNGRPAALDAILASLAELWVDPKTGLHPRSGKTLPPGLRGKYVDETGKNTFDLLNPDRRPQICRHDHDQDYDVAVRVKGVRGRVSNAFVASKQLNRAQAHLHGVAVKTRVAAAVLMANPDAFAASGPAALGAPVPEAAVRFFAAPPVAAVPEGEALIDWFNNTQPAAEARAARATRRAEARR